MAANAWKMASTVLFSIVALTGVATTNASAQVNEPARICATYVSQVGALMLDIEMMQREANRIWAPYGIAIEGLAGPCTTSGEGPVLKIRVRKIDSMRPAGIPHGTLGNIYFVAGKPTPLIDLWADEALRVMGGNHVTFNQGLSDPRVRVEMGRLLGRSLAHELGHYLLGSRVHTEEGLMRSSFGQVDGKQKTRSMFALDEHQVAAVGRTLSTWRLASAERQQQPRPAETTTPAGPVGPVGTIEPTLSVLNTAITRVYTRFGY